MSAEMQDVLFSRHGCAGIITLNRPKALNAVTLGMIRAMHARLLEWRDDNDIACVIIESAGGKAFSAGGDVRALYELGKAQNPAFFDFYREEYQLNAYIKRYPKPYIALIDGIVMGGGVGVSIHGSHRIAGENITFAMPETGIGLFPDVGGTWFLPRCPGEIGMYLGLTGARLKAEDALYAGVVTNTAPSLALAALKAEICDTGLLPDAGFDGLSEQKQPSLKALRNRIDDCFSAENVEAILARLDAAGQRDEWCARQAAIIRQKSPTSLKITYRQLREGQELTFEECMQLEYRIVSRIFGGHDFFEGARAIVIDKDNAPCWRPARLAEVSDEAIDAYFAPLGVEELLLAQQ